MASPACHKTSRHQEMPGGLIPWAQRASCSPWARLLIRQHGEPQPCAGLAGQRSAVLSSRPSRGLAGSGGQGVQVTRPPKVGSEAQEQSGHEDPNATSGCPGNGLFISHWAIQSALNLNGHTTLKPEM